MHACPLVSDLSSGWRFLLFEQCEPVQHVNFFGLFNCTL